MLVYAVYAKTKNKIPEVSSLQGNHSRYSPAVSRDEALTVKDINCMWVLFNEWIFAWGIAACYF